MDKYFQDFEFRNFWDDCKYAFENYVGNTPTDEAILAAENELGYKLPESYIQLIKSHNGGIPRKSFYIIPEPKKLDELFITINGILGINTGEKCSITGETGSKFYIEEWGYPDIGIYICDCPSAGHDMILLDYSKCGPQGEPEVHHVDQESDYKMTFLAKDFEAFVMGLTTDPNI